MSIFTLVCAVALATTLVADAIPPLAEEPSCEWVGTEVVPAGFVKFRSGLRVERAAYEVDVLMCEGGRISVRK